MKNYTFPISPLGHAHEKGCFGNTSKTASDLFVFTFFSINAENFIAFDARSILSLWVAQAICRRHLPTFLLQRWLRIGSSSLSST